MKTTGTEIAQAEETQEISLQNNQIQIYQPSQLLAMAIQKDLDISKLEKLMELQERWQANEAKKEFTVAMAAFKKNAPKIIKNKKANFGPGKASYNYASLGHICNILIESLSEYGLSHRWEIEQTDLKLIKVTCIITHIAGHSESTTMVGPPDASGNKNAIQAISSATSYLQRYSFLAGVGMAAEDQDDDGHGGNGNTQSQSQPPKKKSEPEPDSDYEKFIQAAKQYAIWFRDTGHMEAYNQVCKLFSITSAKSIKGIEEQAKFLDALNDKQKEIILGLPLEFIDKIVGNETLWVAYYTQVSVFFQTKRELSFVVETVKKLTNNKESDPGKIKNADVRRQAIIAWEKFKEDLLSGNFK